MFCWLLQLFVRGGSGSSLFSSPGTEPGYGFPSAEVIVQSGTESLLEFTSAPGLKDGDRIALTENFECEDAPGEDVRAAPTSFTAAPGGPEGPS